MPLPKMTKGDYVHVVWVDITEDSTAIEDVDPYIFETRGWFLKWRRLKETGPVLYLTPSIHLNREEQGKPYGMIAIPKGCIRSIKKVEDATEANTGSATGG